MPFIRVNGLESAQVETISGVLTPKLSKVIGCPEDWICFAAQGPLFGSGTRLGTDVYVHVEWFPRETAVQDEVARVMTQELQAFAPGVETIAVVFVALEKETFYENGSHY